MLLNRKIYCAVIVAAFLSACASAGYTPIGQNGSAVLYTPIGSNGSRALSPLPPASPVYIYSSEKEVAAPFRVIGNISYRNPGVNQIFLFADAVPDLKEQARKVGANGIIIDEMAVSESEALAHLQSYRTPFHLEARAILIEQ
jgi:hypothetical protein